jgi:hypothetical protein
MPTGTPTANMSTRYTWEESTNFGLFVTEKVAKTSAFRVYYQYGNPRQL